MYGIFTYIYHTNQPNVDKCTGPMDPMEIRTHRITFVRATAFNHLPGLSRIQHHVLDFCSRFMWLTNDTPETGDRRSVKCTIKVGDFDVAKCALIHYTFTLIHFKALNRSHYKVRHKFMELVYVASRFGRQFRVNVDKNPLQPHWVSGVLSFRPYLDVFRLCPARQSSKAVVWLDLFGEASQKS